VIEPLPEARVGAVAAEEDRLEDERANDLGMPERDLQRDVTAVAVAEEVGLRDVQVPSRATASRRIARRRRAGHVRGVAMPLLLERDHLSCLGDERDELAERVSMVEPPPWSSTSGTPILRRIAVALVIKLEPVHGRVTALDGAGGRRERETQTSDRRGHYCKTSSPSLRRCTYRRLPEASAAPPADHGPRWRPP